MKKRLIAMLLMLLALPALGEGNALLSLERHEHVSQLFTDGETLYFLSGSSMYTWREGEDAPTPWEDGVELPKQDDADAFWRSAYDDLRFFLDGGRLRGAKLILSRDDDSSDQLFGKYAAESLLLCDAVLAEGRLTAENIQTVRLPKALREEALYALCDLCVHGDALYLLAEGQNGLALCVAGRGDDGGLGFRLLEDWRDEVGLLNMKGGVLLVRQNPMEDRTELYAVGRDGGLTPLPDLPLEATAFAEAPDSDAVYLSLEGRVRPLDAATGALGEPVSALPASPERHGALLRGDRCAVAIGNHVAVLDVSKPLPEEEVLTVKGYLPGDEARETLLRFSVEHPEMAVAQSDAVGEGLLDAMLTRDDSADVYILSDIDRSDFWALRDRGYMLPLEGCPTVEALCGRMYPGLREVFCREGAPVALPLSLDASRVGVGPDALEQLGLSAADVPGDWAGFLDFIEGSVLPRLDRLDRRTRFTYDGLTPRTLRQYLRNDVLADWEQAAYAAGRVPDYEDPRLIALLERLEDLDLEGCGLDEDREEREEDDFFSGGYSYGIGSYVLHLDAEVGFDEYHVSSGAFVPLGFGDDLPGALALRGTAAFVNPYARHPEAAKALVEALARELPETLPYTMCPDLTEPLRSPHAEEIIAYYEEAVANRREELAAAEPKDVQEARLTLEAWEEEYEEYLRDGVWIIGRAQIDWFRAHDDHVTVARPGWFDRDDTGEAYALREQYDAGLLSAREFLAAVNRKARMMELEGSWN